MQLNNEYLRVDKATYLALKDLINDLIVGERYSITDVEFIRDKILAFEREQIVNNLRTVVSKVIADLDISEDIDIEIRDKQIDIVFK